MVTMSGTETEFKIDENSELSIISEDLVLDYDREATLAILQKLLSKTDIKLVEVLKMFYHRKV